MVKQKEPVPSDNPCSVQQSPTSHLTLEVESSLSGGVSLHIILLRGGDLQILTVNTQWDIGAMTIRQLYFGMLVSGGFSSLEIGMRQLSPTWSSSCHCAISSRPFSVVSLEHGWTVGYWTL
jgi:hypothetical protein